MASPIAGNESFTNVENLVGTLNLVDVASLTANTVVAENATIDTQNLLSDLKPTLEGLAVAAVTGSVTYAANTISVSDYDGSATVAILLPAATAGTVVVHYQSVDTNNATAGTLTFSCATNEVFATGSNILTTDTSTVVPATSSVAGNNTLQFAPAGAATNILTVGCMIYFTCTQAGTWHVDADLSGTHAQVTGTFAFSTV